MPQVYPEFYNAFSCKAAACRHSCCRGWEIDIDDGTAARYLAAPGALGDELRAAITSDSDAYAFRLTDDDRCPFLQSDGLCKLIIAWGEDALCDICALHPRFYSDVGAYELCGLGLSCERVCELLLEGQGPLRFDADGVPVTLAQLLAQMGYAVPSEALRFSPPESRSAYDAMLEVFAQTEPIDDAWTRELGALRAGLQLPGVKADLSAYDRVLAYIFYRQIERMDDYGTEAVIAYAQQCTAFIYLQTAADGRLAEHLRRWSEQIEYSTENADILLGGFHR